jgi:hypothetical protein
MESDKMVLIIFALIIGILIGYFILPALFQTTTGVGEGVFGTSTSVSPPTMPP